ncbi:putative DD34D transposase [Trichonephila clavipes]|nr:putative DD34D transposase [Trichonephila clavipes]
MVTGDEKWVTYYNIVRKRSWSKCGEAAQTVTKPGLMARRALLCIWRDWKGLIYNELLPYGQTQNSDIYCQQLDRLKLTIDQKWPTEEVLCSIRTTPGQQEKSPKDAEAPGIVAPALTQVTIMNLNRYQVTTILFLQNLIFFSKLGELDIQQIYYYPTQTLNESNERKSNPSCPGHYISI